MEVGRAPFTPELFVSVIAQGAEVERLSVVIQGCTVTAANAAAFLELIKERIQLIEDDWAQSAAHMQEEKEFESGFTRASLAWIIQNGAFAVNSLPNDGAPILVVVTDGVVDALDTYSYDNLLMQLVRHDIQCHFLRIGSGSEDPNASFGFVPDTLLLRFIADSCDGSVVDYLSLHTSCYGERHESFAKKMTALQEQYFVRESNIHAISAPVLKLDELDSTSFDGRTLLPLRPYRMWREKVHEYRIVANIDRIVEARIREGFVVNKVYTKMAAIASVSEKNSLDTVDERPRTQVSKILIVFLLQWKQNVWLEYVVSSTNEASATSTPVHGMQRSSSQGPKGTAGTGLLSSRKSTASLSKEQIHVSKWSDWYVKMNVLANSDFLRALEDSSQRAVNRKETERESRALVRLGISSVSSPVFLHDFIRNVQDVDRVLLHLLTATATASLSNESTQQFSFGTLAKVSSVGIEASKESSHPVFNIIGELSTVLWHRWFYVERFELLSVVKTGGCMDLFYRSDDRNDIEHSTPTRSSRAAQGPRNFPTAHTGTVYGTFAFGMEKLKEPLMSVILKWSSQRLSRDLFLKFISSTSPVDKVQAKTKAAVSAVAAGNGRRRQRTSISVQTSALANGGGDEGETKNSVCFVRLEFRNKTLCALHVAFFATASSMRRLILQDLKNAIFAGISDLGSSQLPTNLTFSPHDKTLVLCHRMMSRWLVTHETLLLYDHEHESAQVELDLTPDATIATTCCGGSELQLRSVFGAYMWHSSSKWHISNPDALLRVMRRLHEARISSGFWVLDWKMTDDDDGQSGAVESVIFGREILMEDAFGQVKPSLVQYALRRLSSTCLMTSFWMEPQQGIVRSRLSNRAPRRDKFHWSLKQAVGHDMPFEDAEPMYGRPSSSAGHGDFPPGANAARNKSVEDEQSSMNEEDISIDWDSSTFLSENDLLVLLRDYLFKSDKHVLSCLFTFDSITNVREDSQLVSHQSKSPETVVGSTWKADSALAATNDLLLPPFSTARLLEAAKRTQEHFLMFLETQDASAIKPTDGGEPLSPANQHLYSMLERTLRGLSDCEVLWTDMDGEVVGEGGGSAGSHWLGNSGMDDQLPLWLKHRVKHSLEDDLGADALSEGKCFAKVVNDSTVILAFLPALETLQVRRKEPSVADTKHGSTSGATGKNASRAMGESALQQFPDFATEDSTAMRTSRVSVSADDIVLYQERRLSFREGYKSWRMGHYQGSRDEKRSLERPLRKALVTATREDHDFCEEIGRQSTYGCDFHVLVEQASGTLGSGFFQVAFYECSLSRLYVDSIGQGDNSKRISSLPQFIIRQLFFSEQKPKAREGRPVTPTNRNSRKRPHARSGSGPALAASARDNSTMLAVGQFRKKIKRAHEHNFSRGVYVSLRDGAKVQHSDLIQALSSCIEVPMDVDITLLFRMMEVSQPNRNLRVQLHSKSVEILKNDLTKSFEKIFASSFIPIEGTKYYYFTGNESVVYDDAPEADADLHYLVEDSDDAERENPADDLIEGHDSVLATESDAPVDGTQGISSAPNSSFDGQDTASDELQQTVDMPDGATRSVRRRVTIDGLMPSLEISTADSHASTEEDAEFNKEVAVATSSFSVPFFFRFECRVLSSPRKDGVTDARVPFKPDAPSRNRAVSYSEFQRETMTKIQNSTTTEARKVAFDEYVASLKGDPKSQSEDVADIAEIVDKVTGRRISLRLITLTLPNERTFDGSLPLHNDMDSSRSSSGRPTTVHELSALHQFQRDVLRRTRRDIKEWSSVEILSILKSTNRLTPAVGSLVQRLFEDLPDHSVTTAKYPLDFVPGSQDTPVDALNLFRRELKSSGVVNVCECNDIFFVVERKQPCAEDQTRDVGLDKEPDASSEFAYEIPFWAFFVVETDHVVLHLHHPNRFSTPTDAFDRLAVLTKLQLGVMTLCKRVNQFLLLFQLHETRTCNGLLLPADEAQPLSPRSPRRKDSLSNVLEYDDQNQRFFWPGQFECDLRYSSFFRLHERLAPNIALNILGTSALEQFQVHNRRHMFVYRDRDGHVFYMKISVRQPTSTMSLSVSKDESGAMNNNDAAGAGVLTSVTSLANASSSVNGILLEVFGVCNAGEEVTVELCRLLERKLDEATQLVLMKLLARNSKFQLSQNDLAFICPPATKPATSTGYALPHKIAESATLLNYLGQALRSAPYVRRVANMGSLPRFTRETGVDGARGKRSISTTSSTTPSLVETNEVADVVSPLFDPATLHPACFGNYTKRKAEYGDSHDYDARVVSPVYAFCGASRLKAADESQDNDFNETDTTGSPPPVIVDQVTYIMNLNADLGLSSGFLSRAGKGLALLKIDVIKNYIPDEEGNVKHLDVAGLAPCSPDYLRHALVAKCQVWCRGTVHAEELEQIVLAFLEEAVYDYHIEVSIKELEKMSRKRNGDIGLDSDTSLDERNEVELKSVEILLDNAAHTSSSLTKLEFPVPIACWDIENVLDQFQVFLRCLPPHLRPAMYSKATKEEQFHAHKNSRSVGIGHFRYFRLVPTLSEDDSAISSDLDPTVLASIGTSSGHPLQALRVESIHSEMSDADSIRRGPVAGFESLSASQLVSSGSAAAQQHQLKPFPESDLLLHPSLSSQGTLVSEREDPDQPLLRSGRSLYYMVDVSVHDGVRFWGYNMSAALTDTLVTLFSRVFTWSQLREKLLQNMLMEKGGMSSPAPTGSLVIQPRSLIVAHHQDRLKGTVSASQPNDSSVVFIEYWQPLMPILMENVSFPRVLSASRLRSIEGTTIGTYLREAHTHSQESSDVQRPRTKSAASGSGGLSELTRELSSQSSLRSLQGESHGGPGRNGAGIQSRSGSGLSADNAGPLVPVRNGGPPPHFGGGNSTGLPRIRGSGASNALLAARARARGGLPNRMGGPGPGASSRPSAGGDSIAPWDMPLTTAPRSAAPASDSATARPPSRPSVNSDDNTPGESRRTVRRSSILSLNDPASPPPSPTNVAQPSSGPLSRGTQPGLSRKNGEVRMNSWRKRMECAWGPRYLFVGSEAVRAEMSDSGAISTGTARIPRPLQSAVAAVKTKQVPLPFFCDAFQTRWQEYEAQSTSFTIRSNLFQRLMTMRRSDEMDEPVMRDVVEQVISSGHVVLHQRFRVAFVERWEVVELEEEYAGDNMHDALSSARQSSMDLVNLLSYKRDFVFVGNDCDVAKLYVENTVLGMCATEGEAVREMKKQIMKNVFHVRMDVAHGFYQEYAGYLCSLGFRHLRTLTPPPTVPIHASTSASSVSSFGLAPESGSVPRPSAIDQVAVEGESFTEYFFYPWTAPDEWKGDSSDAPRSGEGDDGSYPPMLLVLELTCDHHGVQVKAVLVSERDLKQHAMGFQSFLSPDTLVRGHQAVSGAMVRAVSGWLRSHLQTRAVIYGFTVRFFQRYLLKWLRDFREKDWTSTSAGSLRIPGRVKDASTFQNIVKGIRCFLNAFPDATLGGGISVAHASSARVASHSRRAAARASPGTLHRTSSSRGAGLSGGSTQTAVKAVELPPQLRECVARTAVVELPPTQLHSNCAESILVKILLRYIACHGARYEVLDLMQFGTPDAVVCHSPSGSFFHRPAAIVAKNPAQFAVSPDQFPGYSLVITTQSLAADFGLQAHEKIRRKNCIQLILLKSAPSTLGVGNGVLSVERALEEAVLFTQELFRVSAQHYERDLLWSRLLYDDSTGPGADVADTLGLPADQFKVEVGPQQLEECLRLSICTPLESIDPRLDEIMQVDGLSWQEFGLRLRDMYADQLREFRFEEEDATHLLLLCPNTFDLIIHLKVATPPHVTDISGVLSTSDRLHSASRSSNGIASSSSGGDDDDDAFSAPSNDSGDASSPIRIEICRREEPPNKTFTYAQRRVITEFVNSIVHWQWRSLMYD